MNLLPNQNKPGARLVAGHPAIVAKTSVGGREEWVIRIGGAGDGGVGMEVLVSVMSSDSDLAREFVDALTAT